MQPLPYTVAVPVAQSSSASRVGARAAARGGARATLGRRYVSRVAPPEELS